MARLYVALAFVLALHMRADAQPFPRIVWGTKDVSASCPVLYIDPTKFLVSPGCTLSPGASVFIGANGGCVGDSGGGYGSDYCASQDLSGRTWDYTSATSMTLKSGCVVPGTLSFSGGTSGSSAIAAQAVAGGTSSLPTTTGNLTSLGNAPITASSTAVGTSSSTTETVFSNGSFNIATDVMIVGKTLRVMAWGQMGAAGSVTHLRLRWGANGAPVNTDPLLVDLTGTAGTVTAKGWFATFLVTTRSTGSSGTMIGGGSGLLGSTSGVAMNDQKTAGTTTVATNAAKTLALFGKFDTGNAANTITLEGFTVEFLN